jgi:hypothetical protein
MYESLRRKRAGIIVNAPGERPTYSTGRYRLSNTPSETKAKTLVHRKPRNWNTGNLKRLVCQVCNLKGLKGCLCPRPGLSTIPSQGRIDPFNVFPIMIGPPQQRLLSYCTYSQSFNLIFPKGGMLTKAVDVDSSSFSQNSLAFDIGMNMISIASCDPAWLHATLAVVAVHYGFARGFLDGVSTESLFHRGQALQIVRQNLSNSPAGIQNSVIAAISSLANHEVSYVVYSSFLDVLMTIHVTDDERIALGLRFPHAGNPSVTGDAWLERGG